MYRSVFQLSVFSGFLSADGFVGEVKNIDLIDGVERKDGNPKRVFGLGFKVRRS